MSTDVRAGGARCRGGAGALLSEAAAKSSHPQPTQRTLPEGVRGGRLLPGMLRMEGVASLVAITLGIGAGCGGLVTRTTAGADSGPPSLAGAQSDAATVAPGCSEDAIALDAALVGEPPSSTCSTTGPVVCDRTQVERIPWAASVTIVAGLGDPPTPMGGAVTPGSYQLVSEAVYGPVPPDVTYLIGATWAEVLSASCDTYNELFSASSSTLPGNAANSCGRLVPYPVSLPALAGFQDAGDAWRYEMPYTATASTLTLLSVRPFWDSSIGVLGSYTVVDELVLVGTSAPPASAPCAGASKTLPSATGDPRCPSVPPTAGQLCDPHPAPLECEYGGNAYGRCTTLAACVLQGDGTFRFWIPPPSDCETDAAACPASFSTTVAADAGFCGGGPLICDYPEGACGCGYAGAWCVERPDGGGPCPPQRPLAGDPCPTDGAACGYSRPCSAVDLGPAMICENGHWERLDGQSGCPEGI